MDYTTCSLLDKFILLWTASLSFPSVLKICRLLATGIASSQWWALFKVSPCNLIALYLYSVFLEALSLSISALPKIAVSLFSLAMMEKSTLHAGSFLAISLSIQLLDFRQLVPTITPQLRLHNPSPCAFAFRKDTSPTILCPNTNPLCRHRHRRNLQHLHSAASLKSEGRRRYRRYHRHYHRRVKFLHQRRKPCPKLPQPIVSPSLLQSTWRFAASFINFRPYPADRPILLPPDRDFSSVTPNNVPDLQPPVHPVLIGIVVSQLNPHIYDDSWGWNGSAPPPSRPLHFDPKEISDFCNHLDPIKLHHTLNMFSTPEALFDAPNAPHSRFRESCMFQQKIASFVASSNPLLI